MLFVSISIDNTTGIYLTLNGASVTGGNVFVTDTSCTVAPQDTSAVVANATAAGWITYNMTESSLLKLAWTLDGDEAVLDPSLEGSEGTYTVTGYDNPSVYKTGNDAFYTFVVTFTDVS